MQEIQLTFDEALTRHRQATEDLVQAAIRERAQDPKKVDRELRDLRKLFNRKVRHLATLRFENNYRAAYMYAYKALCDRNPKALDVIQSLENPRGTILDLIQSHGLLPQAVAAITIP